MAEQEQGAAAAAPVAQGPYLSQRHRLETVTAKPKANETGAGVCAILALVVYAALVVMQWMDLTAYRGQ